MKKTLVASACMLAASNAAFAGVDTTSTTSFPTTRGFPIVGRADNEKLGYTVTSAGDFNNDNKDDILITTSLGKAYVVFGKGSTQSKAVLDLDAADAATEFITLTGPTSTATLVGALAGDINNDNIDDLIIGEPSATTNAGQAYVVYGKSSPTDVPLSSLSAGGLATDAGFTFTGTAGKFGAVVAGAGEFNDDDIDDVVISSTLDTDGKLYVIYGAANTDRNTDPDVTDATALGAAGLIIDGASNAQLGTSVVEIGDVNGDNRDDILVGAPGEDKAYIIYGTNANTLDITQAATRVEISGVAGSNFGQAVAEAGDFNNDGRDDLLIAAPEEEVAANGNTEGRVYVLFGQATYGASIDAANLGTTGLTITGATTTEKLGWAVAGVEDINDDDVDDIVVTAQGSQKAYVLFGKKDIKDSIDLSTTLASTAGVTITGQASSGFGQSVSAIGDYNGDGIDDFVITSPSYNYKVDDTTTRTEAGAAWVIYGVEEPAGNKSAFRLGAGISMLASFLVALFL